MISMTPVLTRGYTHWNRSRLPVDEFEERVRAVQAGMVEDGLAALLIFSNTYHCSGDLAYLAGWPIGGALLVLPAGEPHMYTFGGGRELFFQKAQIWVSDMRSVGANYGSALAVELDRLGATSGRVGIVGLDDMPAAGQTMVQRAFAAHDLVRYDDAYRRLRMAKRRREVLAFQATLEIAQRARDAARDAYERGASAAAALVEAERAARLNGAMDYRGLVNSDPGSLRPLEGLSDVRPKRLLLWSAVVHHGYWADMMLDTGAPGLAAACVDAMVEAVRAGATAGDVASAGLGALPSHATEMTLSYGLGSGIGLDLDELPVIEPGSDAVLEEGTILSLRAVMPAIGEGSLAGAIVQVGAEGATRLGSL